MIYLDEFYVVEMQPLKSGPGLEKSGPRGEKLGKMGKNRQKWLSQYPHIYTTTSFFTFDKYTILSSGKGLNILATFKFVLSEDTQNQQKIYCKEYVLFFL